MHNCKVEKSVKNKKSLYTYQKVFTTINNIMIMSYVHLSRNLVKVDWSMDAVKYKAILKEK